MDEEKKRIPIEGKTDKFRLAYKLAKRLIRQRRGKFTYKIGEEEMGVAHSTLSDIDRGNSHPRDRTVEKIHSYIDKVTPKKNLLIIDDHAEIIRAIGRGMKKMGYVVKGALSCAEAMEVLEKEKVDIALIDQIMKKGDPDGINTLQTIRRSGFQGIAIMGTAHGSIALTEMFMRSGGDGLLVKPFSSILLDAKIREILEERDNNSRKDFPPGDQE